MSDSAKLAGKTEQLALVRELKASAGFTHVLLPEFLKRARGHNASCKDRKLTPEKRAEHIEAAHGFEEMVGYLDALEKSLVETIDQIKAGKK